MAQTYRLVGSQDTANRVDRVLVESASDDQQVKTLELNGDPVELSDDQVAKISPFVRLESVDAESASAEEPEEDSSSRSRASRKES